MRKLQLQSLVKTLAETNEEREVVSALAESMEGFSMSLGPKQEIIELSEKVENGKIKFPYGDMGMDLYSKIIYCILERLDNDYKDLYNETFNKAFDWNKDTIIDLKIVYDELDKTDRLNEIISMFIDECIYMLVKEIVLDSKLDYYER